MSDQQFRGMPLVDAIVEYENGEMDDETRIDFLHWLNDNGILMHLQGAYQRDYERLCS